MQEMCLATSATAKEQWKTHLSEQLDNLKEAYRGLLYGGKDHRSSGTVFRSRKDSEVFFSGNVDQRCYRCGYQRMQSRCRCLATSLLCAREAAAAAPRLHRNVHVSLLLSHHNAAVGCR